MRGQTKKLQKKSEKNLSVLPVYNIEGKIVNQQPINIEIKKIRINKRLLSHAVRVYLTNQRQGTASTRTRGEVSGSTRKIYRQKGTGRARHGDIKAPIFVGGGVVGGPKPKEYKLKLNKKQLKKALTQAFILCLQNNKIFLLDNKFYEISPKTKVFINFLKSLNLVDKKNLIIIKKKNETNLDLATANIKNVFISQVGSLNTYQLLKYQYFLFLEDAYLEFLKRLDYDADK